MNNSNDFHTVEDLKFDIPKLQTALAEVLKIKKYDSANGIKNFAAICLNQIPGRPESTEGNFSRGVYWTKPDHTGKEALRDKILDETLYTEFVKDF
ncbi:peptide-aspartate beta-dioxygenase, partial [Pelagibacteraceae bacterium]|nr:peptide-aspartate beta-dioxygenase [Pelagibacteraceae bacterium]